MASRGGRDGEPLRQDRRRYGGPSPGGRGVLFLPEIKRIDAAQKAGTAPEARDCAAIKASLETLHRDPEAIGDAIHRIRYLAKDYAIPEDVCNTFVVTYRRLKEFEDDLHKHVHLENNILFLKATQL